DEGLFKLGDKDAMRDRRHAYYDLLSVAFLPVKITLEGVLEAVSPLGQEERASILIYFLNTYGPNGLYPPHLWNMRERVREGLPRTNNNQEGFHRKWNSLFTVDGHPNLWSWVLVVHRVMNQVQSDIASLESGAPHKRRRTYEVTD
ncbi:hypothetical protein FOZ62_012970, partial [Perkinsus olseni]